MRGKKGMEKNHSEEVVADHKKGIVARTAAKP